MDALEKIGIAGAVPLAAVADVPSAVLTAKALLTGGVDVVAILAGPVAAEAVAAVQKACPEMLVGVGGVATMEQCRTAAAAGAAFVLLPGFREELVAWCVERKICVIPGCVTPAEIMAACAYDLHILGFCPLYGGLATMTALADLFDGIRFLPVGDGSIENWAECLASPVIHAVGGSWLCPKAEIAAREFAAITQRCQTIRESALGFELAHIGVNTGDDAASLAVCAGLARAFGFATKQGSSSNFAGGSVEVMKSPYLGANGHIAIRTNSISRAIAHLQNQGYELDETTAKFKNGKLLAIYLKQEFGGFAVHLLQKT